MQALKRRAIRGALKVLHAVKVVVVACVCLLLGFTARQLFDAYVPEMISNLTQERVDTEVQLVPAPQQDFTVSLEPVEPHWN